uniref:Polyprotein n=1 Tax=Cajanus cajan TaxID=3821 RepID=A0A151RTZ0_CAJCA|nr:polyprotein [Cajanus cajan]
MSPSDLKLAKQECQELLRQGLIEQTTSNWACQAFYVEKRSERLRGKKRLVVDYKPLNHFLKDDKFPLPKTSTLPILLKESKIFSKFDLKSGFWQLGVDPSERHKTAFCIPNAQYQWTVLPFGLKVAPSLFQKAITKILEPLLDNAIIYIDDILLFSKDMESHKKLLSQFLERANLYGIMFSEKKIQLAQQEIYFLGMKFSQGTYQPQPHIAEELLNFPEENLSVKQIQQFLGIINYIRDFIPKIARYTVIKLYKKPSISNKVFLIRQLVNTKM